MKIRGLVLAAGRAERLRPLSDSYPKPLLPFKGTPVLVRTLTRLARAGCDAVAVNLHRFGSLVKEAVGDSVAGMPVTYSEESSILGTLGALGQMRGFLSSADLVLVVNGDTLCEWPVEQLVSRHEKLEASCTLLFSRQARPETYGGGVLVQNEKRVLSFAGQRPETRGESVAEGGERRRYVFAGSYVLDPSLLRRVESGFSDLVPGLLRPLLAEDEAISALVYDGSWHDLGTPGRYLEACTVEAAPWAHSSAQLDPGCRVEKSVVESGVEVEHDVDVVGSVLLDGARVGTRSFLTRCVVGPGVRVPQGTRVEDRLVTPGPLGAGGLSLTPLE